MSRISLDDLADMVSDQLAGTIASIAGLDAERELLAAERDRLTTALAALRPPALTDHELVDAIANPSVPNPTPQSPAPAPKPAAGARRHSTPAPSSSSTPPAPAAAPAKRPRAFTPHGTVDYAEVARLAMEARSWGVTVAPYVAAALGIRADAARKRLERAEDLGLITDRGAGDAGAGDGPAGHLSAGGTSPAPSDSPRITDPPPDMQDVDPPARLNLVFQCEDCGEIYLAGNDGRDLMRRHTAKRHERRPGTLELTPRPAA